MNQDICVVFVFALLILCLNFFYTFGVKEIDIKNSTGSFRVKTDTDIGGIIMCTFPEEAPPVSYVICAIYSFICLFAFILGGYFYFKGRISKNDFDKDRQDTLI